MKNEKVIVMGSGKITKERIADAAAQAEQRYQDKVSRSRKSDVDVRDFFDDEELERILQSNDFFTGKIADVVVCDGFTGNTILKLSEGFYAINCKTGIESPFWEGMNYERAGGTPVLGVNAAVTIGHGKSTPLAIKNMILSTENTIRTKVVEKLQSSFK